MKFKHSGDLIKKIRESAQMTQIEFSKIFGYETAQFISNIERHQAALPPKYWKKIEGLISKEKLLKAYLADVRAQALDEAA